MIFFSVIRKYNRYYLTYILKCIISFYLGRFSRRRALKPLQQRNQSKFIQGNFIFIKVIPEVTNILNYSVILPKHKCLFYQQINSIIVYTANYLPPFFIDLISLLPNYFLLLGCLKTHHTIGWFSLTQLKVGTRTVRWGEIQLIKPFPQAFSL